MEWWQAALWAIAGGFVVEGLEFAACLRRHRKWPWQVDAEAAATVDALAAGPLGYTIGELLRLVAGGVLGAALASQVTGPLAALAIGAAAPAIAGQLATFAPLPQPGPNTAAASDTPTTPAQALPPASTNGDGQPMPVATGTELSGRKAKKTKERGRTS